MSKTNGAVVATVLDTYAANAKYGLSSREGAIKHGMALAYVWGRQDGGETERDSGAASQFADVYTLAYYVTGGYMPNLQGAHHEWRETGRVLVRLRPSGHVVAVQAVTENGATTVQALTVPWVGEYNLPYWPGIIRKPVTAGTVAA